MPCMCQHAHPMGEGWLIGKPSISYLFPCLCVSLVRFQVHSFRINTVQGTHAQELGDKLPPDCAHVHPCRPAGNFSSLLEWMP